MWLCMRRVRGRRRRRRRRRQCKGLSSEELELDVENGNW